MSDATSRSRRRGPEQTLCEALVEAGGFSGAGASLLLPSRGTRLELAATDATFQILAETQFTLWEGPGPEAFTAGRLVATEDLLEQGDRWPLLTATLTETPLPARSHAVTPLRHGGALVGLAGVYRAERGPITAADQDLLIAYCEAITATALRALLPRDGSDVDEPLPLPPARTAIAVGMVVSYLDVSDVEAAALLRAHAFATGTTFLDLATAVVDRRLPLSILDIST